jgi:hypothetical protein
MARGVRRRAQSRPRPTARTRRVRRLGAALSRRWWRRLRQSPPLLRTAVALLAVGLLALGVNALYQVVRKPTELFFPVSGVLYKDPRETWRDYAPLFRRYATRNVSAELLAALAQVEGSGNPLVRTYWRWSWARRPFELYRPASSAVGMYQITDGTFEEARHYCIHAHELAREGRWNDWHACWFNRLYWRVVPADAVELTAAYLDLKVGEILARERVRGVSSGQLRHVAATVHLCGAGAAAAYVRAGFRFSEAQRCGVHDPRVYLRRVDAMQEEFARLADEEGDAGTQ